VDWALLKVTVANANKVPSAMILPSFMVFPQSRFSFGIEPGRVAKSIHPFCSPPPVFFPA
jgi:hypothetical protein